MHGGEVLTVMEKRNSLAHGRLVVNLPNSSYKELIEGHLLDYDALLLSLLSFITGLETDLLIPPVLESGHWQRSQVVPLHRVLVLRLRVGKPLHKRKEVNSCAAIP